MQFFSASFLSGSSCFEVSPLSANPIKWSNTLKQFLGCGTPLKTSENLKLTDFSGGMERDQWHEMD